jgi:hypothetical protein
MDRLGERISEVFTLWPLILGLVGRRHGKRRTCGLKAHNLATEMGMDCGAEDGLIPCYHGWTLLGAATVQHYSTHLTPSTFNMFH